MQNVRTAGNWQEVFNFRHELSGAQRDETTYLVGVTEILTGLLNPVSKSA